MRYFFGLDVLLMTMGKTGTSSVLHWIYMGMTNISKYKRDECGGKPLQDPSSPCWGNRCATLGDLTEDVQWRVLTSEKTIRLAVQRDPYERLISCFKSKFSCFPEVHHTNVRNRKVIVPRLRKEAGILGGVFRHEECMNVSEFGEALILARDRLKATDPHLRTLDRHYRPQRYYFDEIEYDVVWDTHDLKNSTLLQPLLERMPHKELVRAGMKNRNEGTGELFVPERAEKLLREFAKESNLGEYKYDFAKS